MEPESDVGTARDPGPVRRIPPHCEQEGANAEQENEAEDHVAGILGIGAKRGHKQADGDRRNRRGAGGDRDRNPESLPVEPRGRRSDRARNGS